MIRRFEFGSRSDDSGNEKRFVYIDVTVDFINNFHKYQLLSEKDNINCIITRYTKS